MKAIVIHEFGPPEVLRYEDVPDPKVGPGDVLIRVRAATINRVLDCAVRRGEETRRNVRLPLIPGVDATGIVERVGSAVTNFKPGDHVAAEGRVPLEPCPICPENHAEECRPLGRIGIDRPGSNAELLAVPACGVIQIPREIGFAEAAVAMRHVPAAWNLIFRLARLQRDEWILVLGAAGNLGSVGIQIAKNIVGARVICAAGSDERVRVGLELGADYGINHQRDDLASEVMRITAGHGVDVVYDNVANPKVTPAAISAMAHHGRLVTAGAHGGPIVPVNFAQVYDRNLSILGTHGKYEEDRPKCFDAVLQGQIKVRFERIFPLREAAAAHRLLESNPGVGKLILDPTLP